MIVRRKKPDDQEKIRTINSSAFDTDDEANLVDALGKSGAPLISLVAEEKGKLIGRIVLSPVSIEGDQPALFITGMGPMAVMPECQNKGYGCQVDKRMFEVLQNIRI